MHDVWHALTRRERVHLLPGFTDVWFALAYYTGARDRMRCPKCKPRWDLLVTDLVTWLRAQLAEDEQDARRRDFHTSICYRFLDPGGDCSCDYSDHVLADIEAKRRILDLAETAEQRAAMKPGYDTVARLEHSLAKVTAPQLERVLRLLALPYADRPGYQEAWRP